MLVCGKVHLQRILLMNINLTFFPCNLTIHRSGFGENLQETSICFGKNHGKTSRFSDRNQPIELNPHKTTMKSPLLAEVAPNVSPGWDDRPLTLWGA